MTSFLNFDLFAASYRLRCALLCNGLAAAGRVGDRDRRDVVLRRVTQRLCNDDRPPTLYVLNAAAITKPHAIEHLGADLGKGKVFPYSLPSVGPGADPGVQAVSPQVT